MMTFAKRMTRLGATVVGWLAARALVMSFAVSATAQLPPRRPRTDTSTMKGASLQCQKYGTNRNNGDNEVQHWQLLPNAKTQVCTQVVQAYKSAFQRDPTSEELTFSVDLSDTDPATAVNALKSQEALKQFRQGNLQHNPAACRLFDASFKRTATPEVDAWVERAGKKGTSEQKLMGFFNNASNQLKGILLSTFASELTKTPDLRGYLTSEGNAPFQ